MKYFTEFEDFKPVVLILHFVMKYIMQDNDLNVR